MLNQDPGDLFPEADSKQQQQQYPSSIPIASCELDHLSRKLTAAAAA